MISKFKALRIRITLFLGSHRGKTIFNFCYGLGASVAILGVLFKLLHLDGANIMLSLGLGTEVLIFALSALEPPFRAYHWENVFPVLKTNQEQDRPDLDKLIKDYLKSQPGNKDEALIQAAAKAMASSHSEQPVYSPAQTTATEPLQARTEPGYKPHRNPVQDVTPQDARENYNIPSQVPLSEEDAQTLSESIRKMGEAVTQLNNMADITAITENYISKLGEMGDNLTRFSKATGSLAEVSNVLLDSYKNVTENSDEISANSKGYVEQMGNLNRNLAGLNTIYEIQLKSISSQIDTIDRVNNGLIHIREMYEGSMGDSDRFSKETEAMAENLARLNKVYSRMLEAMAPNFVFGNLMANMGRNTPDAPDASSSDTK
jgi:methyl-accepting chemotaxis protein